MIPAIELTAIAITLIVDLWLGNFGVSPLLMVFVGCHWAGCGRLLPALISVLCGGVLLDLIYGRPFPAAMWIAPLALLTAWSITPGGNDGRAWWNGTVVPGAAAGLVAGGGKLFLHFCYGSGGLSFVAASGVMIFNLFFGVIAFGIIARILDGLCYFLGAEKYFRKPPPKLDMRKRRQNERRIRASGVAGR